LVKTALATGIFRAGGVRLPAADPVAGIHIGVDLPFQSLLFRAFFKLNLLLVRICFILLKF